MKNILVIIALLFTVVTAPAQSEYNIQRRTHFETLLIDSMDIVFLGNSITEGCDWAELFDNPRIKNRGISGDRSGWMLDRLDPIIDGKPKKLFLMIGVNDLANGIQPKVIVDNIAKIVDIFKNKSPRTEIYIQSLLPVNGKEFDRFKHHYKHVDNILEINDNLKELCDGEEIEFIDLHKSFTGEGGLLDSKYTNDGLHLTSDGYLLWRKLIKNKVK